MRKILGQRKPASRATRFELTIKPLHVEEVPDAALRVLEPLVTELQHLGARFVIYHTLQSTHEADPYVATLIAPERNAVMDVVCANTRGGSRYKGKFGCVVASQLPDGTVLSTTNIAQTFNKPPEFKIARWWGASPMELAKRHQATLAKYDSPAMLIDNEEKATKLVQEIRRRNFEWKVARGVYVPLTAEELARLGILADNYS